MHIVRTVLWVLLAAVLVLFAMNNWRTVEIRMWTDLILETKVAALAIAAFLLGLVPTWLVGRAVAWRLRRRIAVLETATASAATGASETADPIAVPARGEA